MYTNRTFVDGHALVESRDDEDVTIRDITNDTRRLHDDDAAAGIMRQQNSPVPADRVEASKVKVLTEGSELIDVEGDKQRVLYDTEHKRNATSVLGPVVDAVENTVRIGLFTLSRTLGSGSFGHVRLGFHCRTRRRYAIKVINKGELINKLGSLRSIENEIQIMQSLDHVNIVQYETLIHTEERIYTVMEKLGKSLADLLAETKSISMEQLQILMCGILGGVKHMHQKHISHLDLKTDNIVVKQNVQLCNLTVDDIKLIDFGFSQQGNVDPDNGMVTIFGSAGTRYYLAPEGVDNVYGVDGLKVDMFAVGCILGVLSGQLPENWVEIYDEHWVKTQDEEDELKEDADGLVHDAKGFRKDLSKAIVEFKCTQVEYNSHIHELVAALLSIEPEDRPSAKELLQHLRLCWEEE